MKKHRSYFKNPEQDHEWFRSWVKKLEAENHRKYQRITITTSLGKTHVWGLNTDLANAATLVIFPGARTTSLIWDFDRGLDHLDHPLRIYMVETNGLPNLSDGYSPNIRALDYGWWAGEILDRLRIEKAFVAGASFGGLICMKLGIVRPDKIKAAFLLNAGCLQPFSLEFRNLYYNLLPIVSPREKNISKFLDKAIFCKPYHQLTEFSEKMLIDYEKFAITRYKDRTQKPYYMGKQLSEVKADTYLLEGDQDLLFPYRLSIENASRHLNNLIAIKVFEKTGHGIETHREAMRYIGEKIKNYEPAATNQNQ